MKSKLWENNKTRLWLWEIEGQKPDLTKNLVNMKVDARREVRCHLRWGFCDELRRTWKLNTVVRWLEMRCSCETKTGDLSEPNDVKRKKTCQEINLKPKNKTWQKKKKKTWHDRSISSFGQNEAPPEQRVLFLCSLYSHSDRKAQISSTKTLIWPCTPAANRMTLPYSQPHRSRSLQRDSNAVF